MDKRLYISAIIAFIVYQFVNFVYFPLHTVYPDESRFVAEAIKFAESGEFWKGTSRAWEMPFTGIFYGFLYKIFNSEELLIIAVRIIQSLLLILNAFLVYKIALIVFKDKIVSFVSFFIVLFYPFFIYYQGLLLSETIFISILLFGFYYIYKWYESSFEINKYFFLANFFLVFSIYSKATITILPPFLLATFALLNKKDFKNILKIFFFSFLSWGVLMSPWWIRNYTIFDRFVPFTTSSGANFYLGNNNMNKYGGCDWLKDANTTFVKSMKNLSELEKNQRFKEKAVRFIYDNPSRFVELMWLKIKRFYNIQFNNEDLRKSFLNVISIFSYGTIFMMFLLSIVLNLKNWRKFSAIYMLFLYFTLIHVIVIASLRYRLPLEPFMILMASYSFVYLIRYIKKIK